MLNLKLAIVNQDNLNCRHWKTGPDIHLGCPMHNVAGLEDINGLFNATCFFTRQLEKSLNVVYLNNSYEAKRLAETAEVHGWMIIPRHFTKEITFILFEQVGFPTLARVGISC